MEEDTLYSVKTGMKKGQCSYTHIRKNRLLKKDCNKRPRGALYNDKGVNPARKYNICKYICIQHRRTKIHKANVNRHKGEIHSNTIVVEDLNIL